MFSKVMPIKYQVTEMHRKGFDLLCHPGGIKIPFFQDLEFLISPDCCPEIAEKCEYMLLKHKQIL